MTTWTAEFYEDSNGKRPVESWMNDLGSVEFEAMATAIEQVLQKQGLELAGTAWIKAMGEGLYEFRVRHDAGTIRALYSDSGHLTTSGEDPAPLVRPLPWATDHPAAPRLQQEAKMTAPAGRTRRYERLANGSERGGLAGKGAKRKR